MYFDAFDDRIFSEKGGTAMIEVDARGLSCPEPLMVTDQAMKKHPGEPLKVLVTEAHSRTNVEKFAKSKGRTVTTKEVGQEYEIVIK